MTPIEGSQVQLIEDLELIGLRPQAGAREHRTQPRSVYSITLICAFLVAPFVLHASAAQAQTRAWRCMDDPEHSDCQEALLNDIEDLTVGHWPRPLVLAMPALPYTCNKSPGSGHQVAAPIGVTPNVTTSLPWSIVWTGDLRSFLIGRHTASADLAGAVMPSGSRITPAVWEGTTINYLFREGEPGVMASGGGTGVVELGRVDFQTPSGAFWNGTLHAVR